MTFRHRYIATGRVRVWILAIALVLVVVAVCVWLQPDNARKYPNRDLSNLTPQELALICDLWLRRDFSPSSIQELYFDRQGRLIMDINSARTRDTWPYIEALNHKCSPTS